MAKIAQCVGTAALVAASAIGAYGLGTTAADAAPAHAAARCPSAHTLYRGLNRHDRHHVYRSKRYGIPYGIKGVRCAGRWAAAQLDVTYGSDRYAEPLLEHHVHGKWHEVNGDRPCRRHDVPAKIYSYACGAS